MSNKYFFYPKSPQLIAWQEILRAMSPLSQEIPTDDLVMMTGEFKANTLHDSPPSTSDERAEVVEVTTDHLAVSAEQAPPGDGTCDPDVKVAIVRDENICETVTIDTTTDTTVLATDDSDVQKESIKVTLLADSDEEEGANFSDEALSVFSSDEDSTTPASVGVSPPPTPGLVLHPASTTQSQGNTSKIQGTGRQYSNVKKRKFWSKPKKKALVKKATPLPPLNSKQFVRKCCQPTSSDAEAIVGDDIKSSPSKPQAVRSHTVKPPRPPQPPLARRQSDLAIQETELQPFLHHDSHVSYMTDYLTHDSYTIRVTRAANRRAAYRASRQISMPSTAKSPFLVSPTADIEQNCSIEMTRKAREMEARYPDTLGRNSKPRRLGVNRTQSLGTLANTFTDDIGSNLQLGIGRVLLASTRTSGNQNVHQSPQTSLPIVLATGAASHTAADPALTKNLHSSVLGVRVKEELGNALHIQSLQRRLVADRPIATTHVPQHSVSLDHGLLLLRSASEKSAEQQDSSIRGLSLEDSSRSRVRRGVSLDIHQPKTVTRGTPPTAPWVSRETARKARNSTRLLPLQTSGICSLAAGKPRRLPPIGRTSTEQFDIQGTAVLPKTSRQKDETGQLDCSTSQTDGTRSRHSKSAASSGNTGKLDDANLPFPLTITRHPQLQNLTRAISRKASAEIMASRRIPDVPLHCKRKVAVPRFPQFVLKEAEAALELVNLSMASRERDHGLNCRGSRVRHI